MFRQARDDSDEECVLVDSEAEALLESGLVFRANIQMLGIISRSDVECLDLDCAIDVAREVCLASAEAPSDSVEIWLDRSLLFSSRADTSKQ